MPGPPRRDVTPKSRQIGAGYDPRRPITTKQGTPVYQSKSHAQAGMRIPPQPSAFSRGIRAVGMLGQAPLLARNLIDTSASDPNAPYWDNSPGSENTRQRALEAHALHAGINTLQDAATMFLGPAALPVNTAVDFAYQTHYPQIDEFLKEHILRPKWRHEDANNNGKPGVKIKGSNAIIEDPLTAIASAFASPQGRAISAPISNARLPKGMAGYRGHMSAKAHGVPGQPNYGTHVLDLLTDVLNPLGYAGMETIGPLLGPIGNAVSPVNKERFDPNTKQWVPTGEKTGWHDVIPHIQELILPTWQRDLNATNKGLNRFFQNPTRTNDPYMGF
jgi:hypothetical protein